MIILANDGINSESKKNLEKAGYKVLDNHINQDDLINKINSMNIEIILVRSATKIRTPLIDACKSLKLIGRAGVGMDNIDVNYAREKGIKVINTPNASSLSVAELVIGKMLVLSRNLNKSYKSLTNSNFKTLKKQLANSNELAGKTLTIVGFGRIGQELAKKALALQMNVIAVTKSNDQPIELKIPIGTLNQLTVSIKPTTDLIKAISQADFISLHTPKNKDSKPLIDQDAFKNMKDGVKIIQTSRGGTIDENLLLKHLDSGKVDSAALDVFENEPTPNEALLNHPNIACTPHIGGSTNEAQLRIGQELTTKILETFGSFSTC